MESLEFWERICLVWAGLCRFKGTSATADNENKQLQMSHCLLGWNNKGILIWTRGNLANRARSAFHLHGSRGGEEVAHLPSFRFTLISFDIPQRERGSVWDVHYYSEGVCVTDCASLQPLWIHITPDNPSIQRLNKFIAAVGTCLGLYFTMMSRIKHKLAPCKYPLAS